jgi:predicted RNase H-like nuclease (RuvC/YqgF family)
LKGNLLATKSKKNFQHSEISKHIYSHGLPMIMASDKYPLPKTIERISAAFPSKLMWPRQSLTRLEKIEMTQSFIEDKKPWSNKHERDALAAAIFAFNKIEPLLKRIQKKAEGESADYVAMSTILKGISIDQSMKKFNKHEQIIINEKKSLGKLRKKNQAKKT